MKSNMERLAEAREAVRRDEAERRERSEPYDGPHNTIDTSSAKFRRHNPFYDDGYGHESEEG